MRFAIFVLCWILGLAALDTFAFAAQVPGPPQPPFPIVSSCPGGICPAPAAAPRSATIRQSRTVAGQPVRNFARRGGRVLGAIGRGAGRVLSFPFRAIRGCGRGGCR